MSAEANSATIERLYAAFGECNGAAMTACYAPGAHFRDPAFGDLEGDDIGAMWRMLTGRATDLKIELREHEADEETGSAHWIARYTFSTGRPVVNDIQASFRLTPTAGSPTTSTTSTSAAGPSRPSARAATSSPCCRRCAPKPAPRPSTSSTTFKRDETGSSI